MRNHRMKRMAAGYLASQVGGILPVNSFDENWGPSGGSGTTLLADYIPSDASGPAGSFVKGTPYADVVVDNVAGEAGGVGGTGYVFREMSNADMDVETIVDTYFTGGVLVRASPDMQNYIYAFTHGFQAFFFSAVQVIGGVSTPIVTGWNTFGNQPKHPRMVIVGTSVSFYFNSPAPRTTQTIVATDHRFAGTECPVGGNFGFSGSIV